MSNGVDFRKMAVELRGQLTATEIDLTTWKTKACEAAEREAALREELAGANRRIGACINQIEEQQQRLAAAEQRNSELEVFERFAGYLLDHCEGETIYEESLQYWLSESIKLYKPTESGASE